MSESLAVKYRPKTWDDVTEQATVVGILQSQVESKELQHAYLFCGGAGTGKTTCARIFANEINQGKGNPIELDAASHNGVDDVRVIIQQSKTQSLDSEYRVYILDEVHALSNSAWQAMLKLLEEPPAKSIFIMCTTDPQKIPKTVLSRVQRYQFQRISQQGISNRLMRILSKEGVITSAVESHEAVAYIAKIADGGMRDAITMLDKCLAYSEHLTLENVVNALGATDYETMFRLTKSIVDSGDVDMFAIIDSIHAEGKDLKLFMSNYLDFIMDVCKYALTGKFDIIKIPSFYESDLGLLKQVFNKKPERYLKEFIHMLLGLVADIKYETRPKMLIEATLFQFMGGL